MFHIKAFKKIRGRGLFGVHFKMFHKLFKRIEGLGYIFILRLNRSLPFYVFYGESCHWRRGHLVVELSDSQMSLLLVPAPVDLKYIQRSLYFLNTSISTCNASDDGKDQS